MHDDGLIDESSGAEKKPEVITYYNSTKGGVDVVDELKVEYSVSRISCRWSLKIFFALMNIAGINGQIIFRENTNQLISRRLFLKTLGKELTKNHMIRGLNIPGLSFALRQNIMKFVEFKPNVENINDAVNSDITRTKCHFCPSRKNRYTKVIDLIF